MCRGYITFCVPAYTVRTSLVSCSKICVHELINWAIFPPRFLSLSLSLSLLPAVATEINT